MSCGSRGSGVLRLIGDMGDAWYRCISRSWLDFLYLAPRERYWRPILGCHARLPRQLERHAGQMASRYLRVGSRYLRERISRTIAGGIGKHFHEAIIWLRQHCALWISQELRRNPYIYRRLSKWCCVRSRRSRARPFEPALRLVATAGHLPLAAQLHQLGWVRSPLCVDGNARYNSSERRAGPDEHWTLEGRGNA